MTFHTRPVRRDRLFLVLRPSYRWWCLGPLLVVCVAGGLIAVDNAAADFMTELMETIGAAAADAVTWMLTWWLDVPTVAISDCANPQSASCGQASGTIAKLQANTGWITGAIAVGAVLWASIKMAVTGDGKVASDLLRGIVTLVVMSAIGLAVIQLFLTVGDAYSGWIIDRAAGDRDVQESFGAVIVGAVGSGQAPVLLIVLLLIVLFSGIIQIILLFGRMAGLILIAGLLPVAAAAGLTEGGKAMRDRYLSWLIMLVLYKPVAATVWAAAFWVIGDAKLVDLDGLLVAAAMFVMALFAMPALMRLIAPAVSVATSGGGGGAGGLAAAGYLASGAMQGGGRKSKTGTSGGSSPAGSSASPSGSAPSGPAGPSGSGGPAGSVAAGKSAATTATGSAASGTAATSATTAASGAVAGPAASGAAAGSAGGPPGAVAGAAVATAGTAAKATVDKTVGTAADGATQDGGGRK